MYNNQVCSNLWMIGSEQDAGVAAVDNINFEHA
jgi:hypothetical protein